MGSGGPPKEFFLVIFIQNGAILGNSNKYVCLDTMPQKEDRLPIYLKRDVYMYIVIHTTVHSHFKEPCEISMALGARP